MLFRSGGSIKYDYEKSLFTFRASSVTQMMKNTTGFSVSVESMAVSTKWYELLDLDCRRAMYHYLRWHSTVLKIADFNFTGTDYKIQFFDADRVSLYNAINSLMQGNLVGDVSADRQGRLWAEVKPKSYPNPTGTFVPVMDITNRDWMGQPSIEESYGGQVSYIEYGGAAFSGVFTGTFSPLLADAPDRKSVV